MRAGGSLFFAFLFSAAVSGAGAVPVYSGRQETPLLMRALTAGASRAAPQVVAPPRGDAAQKSTGGDGSQYFDFGTYTIMTKQQYIQYLRAGYAGQKIECQTHYDQYNSFFRADSTQSGTITGNASGNGGGRFDSICNFLSYAHWCFALGFAYAMRDPDDGIRVSTGNRCYTYDEFCQLRGKVADPYRIDDYLSKVIDEISVYNTDIRATGRNTVSNFTRGPGNSVGGSYKVYDTDSWIMERLTAQDMTRLLCK